MVIQISLYIKRGLSKVVGRRININPIIGCVSLSIREGIEEAS